jgi:hypothetical protein
MNWLFQIAEHLLKKMKDAANATDLAIFAFLTLDYLNVSVVYGSLPIEFFCKSVGFCKKSIQPKIFFTRVH